jgi:hypothetical protein
VRAMKTSMDNAVKNLKILDEGILDNSYVESSLLLRILPKWKLEVFNEVYIVRTPLKCDHTNAWIVPEKDSDDLDNKLQMILLSCGLGMTNIDIENIQRAARQNFLNKNSTPGLFPSNIDIENIQRAARQNFLKKNSTPGLFPLPVI